MRSWTKIKTLTGFVLACFAALLLSNCKKDTVEIIPVDAFDEVKVDSAISHVFYERGVPTQTFRVSNDVGGTITGAQGTRITFPKGIFVKQNGDSIKGEVIITIREVYKKSDMVLTSTPTRTHNSALVSGGEVYVNAEQDGFILDFEKGSDGMTILMPVENTQNPSQAMQLFSGNGPTSSEILDWRLTDSSSWIPIRQIDSTDYYMFTCDFLNWINCDHFWGINPQTSVTVDVPSGFDNENTAVFMVFADESAATRIYAFQGAFTTASGYSVPIGQGVTFAAISSKDGTYKSAFSTTTIANEHLENLTFSSTTIEDFMAELKKLD